MLIVSWFSSSRIIFCWSLSRWAKDRLHQSHDQC